MSAIRATTQAVRAMTGSGVGLLRLKAKVLYLRMRYRWKSLSVVKEGPGQYSVEGVINPRQKIAKVVPELETMTAKHFSVRYRDVEERALSELDVSDPRERISSKAFELAVVAGLKAPGRTAGGISRPVAGPAMEEMAPHLAGRPIQFESRFGSSPARDISVAAGKEVALAGTNGSQRVRRIPEAMVEERVHTAGGRKVQALYIVEATLDLNFMLKEGRASHKKSQLPQSVTLALGQLRKSERTKDFKIVYTIFSHGEPSDDVRDFLNQMIRTKAPGGVPVEAMWIVVPLT